MVSRRHAARGIAKLPAPLPASIIVVLLLTATVVDDDDDDDDDSGPKFGEAPRRVLTAVAVVVEIVGESTAVTITEEGTNPENRSSIKIREENAIEKTKRREELVFRGEAEAAAAAEEIMESTVCVCVYVCMYVCMYGGRSRRRRRRRRRRLFAGGGGGWLTFCFCTVADYT